MATKRYSVEIAGVDLAGQNHGCAFFNSMDEEHRVLRSFYQDDFDRGEKATHEAYLNRLAEAGVNVRELIGRRPTGSIAVDREDRVARPQDSELRI
jgi:hypothetical protein